MKQILQGRRKTFLRLRRLPARRTATASSRTTWQLHPDHAELLRLARARAPRMPEQYYKGY